jgi:hypothetical protein
LAGPITGQLLARDELIAGRLLLPGLRPEEFETRVRRAIDAIPDDASSEGVVHVRAIGLESQDAVKPIMYAAAPETAAVRMQGAHPPSSSILVEALLRT